MKTFLGFSLSVLMVGLAQAQARPAITGIAFVRVYAADAAASEKFYRSLGFVPEAGDGMTRYAVNDRQWVEVAPLPAPAPTSRLAAVGLMTRDAAAMERYLKVKGVAVDKSLHDGEFGVRDPEGNRIIFVQAGSGSTQTRPMHTGSVNTTSQRIIHAGFMVKDRAAEDRFYRDVLGFTPYWHGGMTEDRTDWVSQQVPDGSDWLEYMLNAAAQPSAQELGGMNHFSLGVVKMHDAAASLQQNHCEGPNCMKTQMGRDGKVQLNVFDPDLTRVEFMEFKPSGVTCCSPLTGKAPGLTEAQ